MELLDCPQCRAPAEVLEEAWLESTDTPVQHLWISCVHRHRFLVPA